MNEPREASDAILQAVIDCGVSVAVTVPQERDPLSANTLLLLSDHDDESKIIIDAVRAVRALRVVRALRQNEEQNRCESRSTSPSGPTPATNKNTPPASGSS